MKKRKIIIGIDEAGRGPLAGPICVGAVSIKNKRLLVGYQRILTGIKDSKKLSAQKREKWNEILRKYFECHFSLVGNKVIDKIGIVKATALGVKRVLKKFSQKPDLVLLDGLLKAPKRYEQKTIIKGDEKVPIISASSIIAKVARDKKMVKLSEEFPQYCFHIHKGYGTKMHYNKIKKNGLSAIHRKSFCKKHRLDK